MTASCGLILRELLSIALLIEPVLKVAHGQND